MPTAMLDDRCDARHRCACQKSYDTMFALSSLDVCQAIAEELGKVLLAHRPPSNDIAPTSAAQLNA